MKKRAQAPKSSRKGCASAGPNARPAMKLKMNGTPQASATNSAALRPASSASSLSTPSRRCSSKNGPPCEARYSPIRLASFLSASRAMSALPTAKSVMCPASCGRARQRFLSGTATAGRRPSWPDGPARARGLAAIASIPRAIFASSPRLRRRHRRLLARELAQGLDARRIGVAGAADEAMAERHRDAGLGTAREASRGQFVSSERELGQRPPAPAAALRRRLDGGGAASEKTAPFQAGTGCNASR